MVYLNFSSQRILVLRQLIGREVTGLGKVLILLLAIGVFIQLSGLLLNNDGSRYATQLYLALFLPALLLLLRERLMPTLWRQAPAILLLLLLGWVLLYAGVHPGSDKDFWRWLKLVLLLIFYVAAVASLAHHERLLRVVLVMALIVAALFAWLTLYYQFVVIDRPLSYEAFRWVRLWELGWRGFGDLKHPIIAGLYYSIFVIVATWLLLRSDTGLWRSLLLMVAIAGLAFYVLLTFSRGSWFSLGAGGLALLLITSSRKSYALLGMGAVLLCSVAYWFWPELQNEQKVGVNGRDLIWGSWLARLPEFWLMGRGAGADFEFTFPAGQSFIHAHSLYLQLWYEYGVVGIGLFLAFLLSLLFKAWQCRALPLAQLAMGLLVLAMVAMISDVYAIFHRPSPYWALFWFPVGILLGLKRPVT